MSSWRDQILNQFTPRVARLTLVADPDGLLLEEGLLGGIRERGFELIPFEDHVAFRYAYESRFRSRWDRGEETDLVVVLRSKAGDLNSLPYDLLQAGRRRLSFSLADIFPNLSYPVVDALDRGYLDALFDAQKRHAPGHLGDNATKEFVLRHVFEIAPELIKQPSDLLRVLLRRHYREQRIPAILDEHLIKILRQNEAFMDWPLEEIIPDHDAFFAFLQERWPAFLDHVAGHEGVRIGHEMMQYKFSFPGPAVLPFDHDDIRVYIDNLFLDGLLHTVRHERSTALSKKWVSIGIRTDGTSDRLRRVERLIEAIQSEIPKEDARHNDWLHFAFRWAEFLALSLEPDITLPEQSRQKIRMLCSHIDSSFTAWLLKRYAGLINLPPSPPVMLHHVPRFLARYIAEAADHKVAFLVVDGLSLDQWIIMREILSEQQPLIHFREDPIFAWIPTITSVSRQAAFSGKLPLFFPGSIYGTEKDTALWTQFWIDQGLTQHEIAYAKGLGDGSPEQIKDILSRPGMRVVGLVIDKVDKIMHGMELGAAGMHNQIRQWTKQGYMAGLFDALIEHGYHICLTSDHGNIEAAGCGRPAEGAIAEHRGERVRIYSDALLRRRIKERFPDSLEWNPVGLPEDFLPLIALNRTAFVRENESLVCHGGISIEELIVPLVHIEKRKI